MIELIAVPADNVVGIRVAGKIEKADIERVMLAVEKKLASHAKLRIYVEIDRVQGISLEAFLKDLRFGLPHVRDFEKKAVVSDSKWLEIFVALGDKLFPSIEVRHFASTERAQALDWVQS